MILGRWAFAGLLIVMTGCGYSSQLYRPDIRTVHVEIFESREFRRGLEFLLTEALKKRIAADTPYRLADRETADTILKGEVLEVREAAFARDFRTRLPRDKQMTIVVRVQWQDQRSGEMLLADDQRLASIDYLPPLGESQAYAEQKVVNRLAERIIARMYDDNW